MREKTYNIAEIERKLSKKWSEKNFFKESGKGKKVPFCVMMPPANITGSLHMGHALTYTLQDVLIRFNRMQGRDVLWQPGVDHAGIATQMVVERQLDQEGLKKSDLGREAFLDRIWAWKEESGGVITEQLKRLGASANWERSRFTMDEKFNKAVNKCFISLFDKGLIYRDKRLVNWDVKFQTAVSDLEVELREEKGTLWYIKYPLEDDPSAFITVATTRPETMLGDTAVAVHKDDERYKHLIGKRLRLPLTNRIIPIIADEHCDPEKGSGAVKITPAHDFNDFQVGKRQNLDILNIFDSTAHLNDNVPEIYQGLERFASRRKILEDLQELELLEKEEPIVHSVPYGDRSGVIIEPWMTDQWFVDAKKLSYPAIKAVEKGDISFVPKQWAEVYFEWLRNIEPWCISRQIWWGHQIPAWHGPDGHIFVASSEKEAIFKAKKYYGEKDFDLIRDTDVLDTWFSSSLWPFVTLGWPENTKELKQYYPTQVLVTGTDLVFFWVARMIMMGLHFTKDIPFSTVYMHPLVLDEKGEKMSKSKGNVINPLELIEKYGADALRYTITSLSVQGKNIKLAEKRVEGSRNFVTKIWNISRYLMMNECTYDPLFNPHQVNLSVNQWIIYKLSDLTVEVTEALQTYKFNEASHHLYQFVRGTFCDWYVEFTKPILKGSSVEEQEETRKCLAWCFFNILKLLHPMMPFVTDSLSMQFMNIESDNSFSLSKQSWPIFDKEANFDEAARELDWISDLVAEIRSLRTESNIAPKTMLTANILGATDQHKKWIERHQELVFKLARLDKINVVKELPAGCIQLVQGSITIGISLGDIIDIDKEKNRLRKEIERLVVDLKQLKTKLKNKKFMERAPKEIVDEQLRRRDQVKAKIIKIQQALERIEGF